MSKVKIDFRRLRQGDFASHGFDHFYPEPLGGGLPWGPMRWGTPPGPMGTGACLPNINRNCVTN